MHKSIKIACLLLLFLFLGVWSQTYSIIPSTGLHNDALSSGLQKRNTGFSQFLDSSILIINQNVLLRIVEQPDNNYEYVSDISKAVTRFQFAEELGSIGLLAHNSLAGKEFSDLRENDQFIVSAQYEDQFLEYTINEILKFQAVDPTNASSWFRDLETGEWLSSTDLAVKIYNRPGELILQTCIEKYGNSEWGRLFIIAEPS